VAVWIWARIGIHPTVLVDETATYSYNENVNQNHFHEISCHLWHLHLSWLPLGMFVSIGFLWEGSTSLAQMTHPQVFDRTCSVTLRVGRLSDIFCGEV
jgi:hypothetical protein